MIHVPVASRLGGRYFQTPLAKEQMARKIKSRLALREEVEAAERAGIKKKKAVRKTATPRKRAKKTAAEARTKLFWGVFNQSLKRVALYEFDEKKKADQKATDLSKDGKSPHFVQKVKEVIEE